MPRIFCFAFGVALFGLAVPSLFAQTAPAQSSPPRFRITARTVVEDVVVMDKDGHPVPNLRKQDFRIYENGKPQAITFFDSNFTTPPAKTNPALPPDTFTNIPAAPPNGVTNVLLLDALDTRPTERMYAQSRMVKYLASLPSNMRIAVFTLDNERFHMTWGFNQDSSALREAVARFVASHSHSKPSSGAAQQEAERQELIQSVDLVKQQADRAGDEKLGQSADALQKFLKNGTGILYEYGHSVTTWNAFEALAHYLAGIPGRKNLFWVAGTFPHCFKSDPCFDDWYRPVRDALTRAEVSVYPIDANGVDVDTGGFQPGSFLTSASTERFQATESWAEDTGGKAYHENDISQEIAAAAEHGSRYYTLAYVPSDAKEDGRERNVEVKVLSGEYTLFYRKSYYEQTRREIAKSSAAPAKGPLIALMGRGMPDIAEIPYRLIVVPRAAHPAAGEPRAGENKQLTGKLTRYDITFRLVAAALSSLTPDAKGVRRESLDVMVLVYSHDGKPLNWESHTLTLLIRPEQWPSALNQGVSFQFDIDAPPGDVYLRTGIYDAAQSKVGTLEVPLSAIDSSTENRAALAPSAIKAN